MPTNPFTKNDIEAVLGYRYSLGAELRVGGQGVVYRGIRQRDASGATCNDEVALKIHLDSNQDERIEREIAAAKDMHHPTLATLLEEGSVTLGTKKVRYIAWEFIEGEPLDLKLSRSPLSEKEAAQVGLDVLSAIEAIWSRRIVHRDISPKNIMVKPDGRAVLIDLGGARHLDRTTITAPGLTFGTVGYFSPEQCRAEHTLTSASDVFALGVVLLEALAGHHPTHLNQHALVSSPPPAAMLVPGCSVDLQNLIDRMLRPRAPFRPSLAELRSFFASLVKVV